MKKFASYPSTFTALFALLLSAFMAQPTLASLVVHIFLLAVLAINNWLAHWEGRNTK